jgi:hypothetical protein
MDINMINIDNYLNEICNESYSSTMTKRGRIQKTSTTTGAIGVALARQKNDPLYRKMIYYKHLYQKTKEQLQRKYKSRASSLARKKASSYKKQ